jgi:hypothetical protein
MACIISACSPHAIPTAQVGCESCDEAGRFVRLQSLPESGKANITPPFSHPFQLTPEEWKTVLESIQVRKRGQGPLSFLAANKPAQQALTPQEIQYLCEVLPRVFAEVQPSDLVVFGLTNARTPEITDVTTGAWYVKGATLYLVLGNYREGVTMPSIRELVWRNPLHVIAAPLYDFVPGPYQAVSSSHNSLVGLLNPEPLQLALTYQPIATGPSSVDDHQPTGLQRSTSPEMSLEDKLRRLKQLHNEGLITDDEYAAKKHSLLNGL